MDAAALKAAGFSDKEIRLHQAGFSDAEIQAHTGPSTLGEAVSAGINNFGKDAVDTAKGVIKGFTDLPGEMAGYIKDPSTILAYDPKKNLVAGAIQRVRDLSPADQQGSAPRMDTTAYDDTVQSIKDNYGSKKAIYKTLSDHPVAPVMAAASLAIPALRAAGADAAVGDAAGVAAGVAKDAVSGVSSSIADGVAPVVAKVKHVVQSGQRAKAGLDAMSGEVAADASAGLADASAKAPRVASIAERFKARQDALATRQAEAAKAAAPPQLDTGEPAALLSDRGDMVRTPAMEAQKKIEADMQAANATHRAAMNAVTADREAAGVGISDMPTAKALVAKSEAIMKPDPVTRPVVGTIMPDDVGGTLHNKLIEALKEQKVRLDEDQAYKVARDGKSVLEDKDGLYTIAKPGFEAADNFRRYLGQVMNGNIEGFKAINQHEAAGMYKGLTDAISEYVDGANGPVQQNWRDAKKALEPFEKVRAGQAIVGTQAGVDAASVPAASIPGRIVTGGRDAVEQVKAVAGPTAVQRLLRSHVQSELEGVTDPAAIARKVGPNSKLGDVIATDDGLSAAVKDYMSRAETAQASGTQAVDLGNRAATAGDRADRFSKLADTLNSDAAGHERNLTNIRLAKPPEVTSMYRKMLDNAHGAGRIDATKYDAGKQLAANTESDLALKAKRNAIALMLGVPAIAKRGWSVLTH